MVLRILTQTHEVAHVPSHERLRIDGVGHWELILASSEDDQIDGRGLECVPTERTREPQPLRRLDPSTSDLPDKAELLRALGAGCNGVGQGDDFNGIGQAQIQSVCT